MSPTEREAFRLYRRAVGVPWWRPLWSYERREARLLMDGVVLVRRYEAMTSMTRSVPTTTTREPR